MAASELHLNDKTTISKKKVNEATERQMQPLR
jgi:hypothetical protein